MLAFEKAMERGDFKKAGAAGAGGKSGIDKEELEKI